MNAQATTQNQPQSAPQSTTQRRTRTPLVDIYENKDELVVVVDVPGVNQDDINIRFFKGQLTLDATRYFDSNRTLGLNYSRVFQLPNGLDADKIMADYQQGVLAIHLPKHEAVKPRQIKVSVN